MTRRTMMKRFLLSLAVAVPTCLAAMPSQAWPQEFASSGRYETGYIGPGGPRGEDGHYYARYVRNFDPAQQYTLEVASNDFDPRIVVFDGTRFIDQRHGTRGGAPARVVLPRGAGGNLTIFVTAAQPSSSGGNYFFGVLSSEAIAVPADRLAGAWHTEQNDRPHRVTRWTFTPRGDGTYDAAESGSNSAIGTATLVGNQLRIEWREGDWSGAIVVMLDPSGRAGSGYNHVRTVAPRDSALTMRKL